MLRQSKYVVMTDATMVLLISGFLSVKAMDISELLDDSTYLEQFKHPLEVQDCYIPIPQVLNRPIQDIGAHLEEIGMHACGTRVPLHHILACLLEYTPETLCQQLWKWVLHYSSDVHMIEKWLNTCHTYRLRRTLMGWSFGSCHWHLRDPLMW